MNKYQKAFIDRPGHYLMHYNHNHDKLGRFASSNGRAIRKADKKIQRSDKKIAKYQKAMDKAKQKGNTGRANYYKQYLEIEKYNKKQAEDAKALNESILKDKAKIQQQEKSMSKIKFSNNDKCDIDNGCYEDANYNKTLSNIKSNEKTIDNQLRKRASDNLYEWRGDNLKNQSKEEFSKKLRCEQITIQDDNEYSDSVFWYHHPDDYGDWMMIYNSKTKKVIDEQFFR